MSDSVRVNIIVEGQNEQTFIRDVLSPELAQKNLYLYPVLIGKPGHKGGNIDFERAKTDIGNFLKQQNSTYITTMFDYYGIDKKWPGKEKIQQIIESGSHLTANRKAQILESETYKEIISTFPGNNTKNRFIPYFEMHEFEALLFSNPAILAKKTGIEISQINQIIYEFNNPEEINDNPETAPSKRLMALKSGYRKVAIGKIVTESIGIQTIRERCPHFDLWLRKLENLT